MTREEQKSLEAVHFPSTIDRLSAGLCTACGKQLAHRTAFYRSGERNYCPECAEPGSQKYALMAVADTGGEHYVRRYQEFK